MSQKLLINSLSFTNFCIEESRYFQIKTSHEGTRRIPSEAKSVSVRETIAGPLSPSRAANRGVDKMFAARPPRIYM